MPVSIEAEQALLGSIIIRPESFDKIGGMVDAEDFYLEEHKHIYSALVKMYTQSKMIDTVTLVNALVEQGDVVVQEIMKGQAGLDLLEDVAGAARALGNLEPVTTVQ